MYQIPVVSPSNNPLMPTTPSRARRWIESGKATKQFSKLGVFYVQLTQQPSGTKTQKIVIGIDPGKLYSGIAVQSQHQTLFTAHLVLPFKRVKARMETRAMMRRTRRGRRINRDVEFKLRSHRQARFSNRKRKKVPPSIRANRQLEFRVSSELCKLYPISTIVVEYVKARTNPGCSFSPVQVGQKWAIERLNKLAPTKTLLGWETAQIRRELGLIKSKDKSLQSPESHAVDGIALAASEFMEYRLVSSDSMQWVGSAGVTSSMFKVIQRPPISRRQLHLLQFTKGGQRRKYGGSTIRHFGLRKGDLVKATKAGCQYIGYVSGDTRTQVSVSDSNWKRIGQFTASKVQLIARATGLLVSSSCSYPSLA